MTLFHATPNGNVPFTAEEEIAHALEVEEAQKPTQAKYEAAIYKLLNDAAITKKYSSIESACTFVAPANAFSEESAAFVSWRAAVWSAYIAKVAEMQVSNDFISVDALIDFLPKFGG